MNAHGTATVQNDRSETLAIKQVFGDHAYRMPVSSTKSPRSATFLCASGGVELVVTIEALRHGVIPSTINLDNPDPDCDLDYVPHPRPRRRPRRRPVQLVRLRRAERLADRAPLAGRQLA